ncbi:hypothetical protein [Absidia glauca]|uniref:Uncharacterized protein n=1 Tax=Absidia glauca TaxID=4829 RepID=A0A163TIM8_ABSGL|nr:hypothetical protein [Absidia glauca]
MMNLFSNIGISCGAVNALAELTTLAYRLEESLTLFFPFPSLPRTRLPINEIDHFPSYQRSDRQRQLRSNLASYMMPIYLFGSSKVIVYSINLHVSEIRPLFPAITIVHDYSQITPNYSLVSLFITLLHPIPYPMTKAKLDDKISACGEEEGSMYHYIEGFKTSREEGRGVKRQSDGHNVACYFCCTLMSVVPVHPWLRLKVCCECLQCQCHDAWGRHAV